MNPFHCCATCKHFSIVRIERKSQSKCSRLGYDTKPTYQFSCWDPKEKVVELMKKRGS